MNYIRGQIKQYWNEMSFSQRVEVLYAGAHNPVTGYMKQVLFHTSICCAHLQSPHGVSHQKPVLNAPWAPEAGPSVKASPPS